MKDLFNSYCVCINLFDNKVSILSNKMNINTYNIYIDKTRDIDFILKEMIKTSAEKIPFSFFRSKIVILVSDYITINELDQIYEIAYKNGKNKFREIISLNYGASIIGAFGNWNRCIYLVQINNQIFGFAGCAGEMITKMIYFNSSNTIDYMINTITNEINEEKYDELKMKIKNIDINSLWNKNEILISFNYDYYYNKKIENIKNNYIPDILNVGLIKYAKNILQN